MTTIQLSDAARMSPQQRRTEAAALLALGLHRLRGGDAHNGAVVALSPVGLGCGGEPRVHANPAHRSP
jgi:hypothetical protein